MTDRDEIAGWFQGRLPDDWFVSAVTVEFDRDEIQVVGSLAEPKLPKDASDDTRAAALSSRIQGFREDTRGQRMRIADEAQQTFQRKVSWGATCGEHSQMFTTLSTPAMTRLRMQDRAVLDTLVEAGVARSRSHALAWCVRLVDQHQDEWLRDLRDALASVEQVRASGPTP
jgi:hypothetical protein